MYTINKRPSKKLLYEDVINSLYDLIDRNDFKPGDKLPSERELTEALGISRNVLREAFHVLEKRGIIRSRQGSGRYLRVIPSGEDMKMINGSLSLSLERYSLADAYEVRQVLEVKAVELVVKNASDKDIEELEMALNTLETKFKETNSTEGEFEIHKLYAMKSGSAFLEEILDLVLYRILEIMHSKMISLLSLHMPEDEIKSHREIIAAICERNADKAGQLMYDHMQSTISLLETLF